MERLRRIIRAFRGVISWLNLPFDIQTLWNFFRQYILPALPALAVIVLGYLQHAAFWQIALLAIAAFVVAYLVIFGLIMWWRRTKSEPQADALPSAVIHEYIQNAYFGQPPATQADTPEATIQKRRAAKQLLGEAAARGRDLQPFGYFDAESGENRVNTKAERQQWVDLTRDFLEDAFDKSVAAHFMSAGDYKIEGLDSEDSYVRTHRPYFMPVRVWRIDQIAADANSLEVNPDFDPEQWEGCFKTQVEQPDKPRTQRSPEELKALCLHLGYEVYGFESKRSSLPGWEYRVRMKKAESEEEQKALKEQEREVIRHHNEETVELYHRRYKPRIMELYDELTPHWFDDGDRELFENVDNWAQLGDVAERLKTVGERLPGG